MGAYSPQQFALIRYNANGSLDESFGSGGIALAYSGGALAMRLQTDGKAIMTGYTGDNFPRKVLARFLSNGQEDTSFGSNGRVISGALIEAGSCLAIQPDGKIIMGTQEPYGTGSYFERYLP